MSMQGGGEVVKKSQNLVNVVCERPLIIMYSGVSMMLKKLFSNYVAKALGLKILLNKKTPA